MGRVRTIRNVVALLVPIVMGCSQGSQDLGCSDCPISLSHLVVFGDSAETVVDEGVSLVEVGDEYWVTHRSSVDEIMVIGPDADLGRTVGRQGMGPGEFRFITGMGKGPSGDVWAFDPHNRRVVVLNPDGSVSGNYPLPVSANRRNVVMLPDSSYVINGFGTTPESAGFWVHRVSHAGDFIWSAVEWGPSDGRGGQEWAVTHDSNGVWVSKFHGRFILQLLSVEDGRVLREFAPERPWYSDNSTPPADDGGADHDASLMRPTSKVRDIWSDGEHLWVLGSIPGESWESARQGGFTDIGEFLDVVIDVYDTETGELIVHQVLDPPQKFFERFTPDGRLVVVEFLPTYNRIHLYRPSLAREVSP